MTLILITIVGAMIVGLLAGGSFRNFPSIPLSWWSLAIVGVVLQFLPLTGSAGSWSLTASFVLLIAFALLNFRAPGFILIFTGLLLNAIVIVANHGMPVSREALVRSGQESTLTDLQKHGGYKHHLADDDTVLLVWATRSSCPNRSASRSAWGTCASTSAWRGASPHRSSLVNGAPSRAEARTAGIAHVLRRLADI